MPSVTAVDVLVMLFLYKPGECFQPCRVKLFYSFLAKYHSIDAMIKKEIRNYFRISLIFADFVSSHVELIAVAFLPNNPRAAQRDRSR